MTDHSKKTRMSDVNESSSEKFNVESDTAKLFAKKYTDIDAMSALKRKYGKDTDKIYEIYDNFKSMKDHMVRKAEKFRRVIYDRYGVLPFDSIFKKAKKYAKKYKISDDVFNYFFHLATTDRINQEIMSNLPNTKISQALGYGQSGIMHTERLNIKDSELPVLQEILKIYGETKVLHSQIVLQALQYRDCAIEAINGTIPTQPAISRATDRQNFYTYIHPILAALFLPKFNIIDEHVLLANIGYIVSCKHNKQLIKTKPDYNLYWDMITDYNDVVCSLDSAITDLRNRQILQTKIWDAVLHLRQGKYYASNVADFLMSIENCRSNIYDAPDMTYVKDEGTILRKLLTAFAIRPTIVSTSRLQAYAAMAPYGVSPAFMSSAGLTKMSTISMVTLRIPLKNLPNVPATSLEDALVQPQWFIENKMLIPKSQQIMYSKEVLIFYVNRRFKTVNIANINAPYNFSALPHSIAGWEKLNDHPVNYDPIMNIVNDTYLLRSVVFVETSRKIQHLITGCTTGIIVNEDAGINIYGRAYLLYDPQGATEIFRSQITGDYIRNGPITEIPGEPQLTGGSITGESFAERATNRGTIFIYKKHGNHYNNPYISA
jgi:hypothetical protein